MLCSSVAFCGMSTLIRYAASIDSFRVALCRFVIGLALLGTAALFGKIRLTFVHGRLLFFRGLTGGVAVFLFFLSIAKLGMGKGTIISYSYPVFATVFGGIILKERIGLAKAVLVATALVGIYFMTTNGSSVSSLILPMGRFELLAVLGAIFSGIAVVLVKKLHDTDTTYAIFFAQCAIGLWVVIIPANVTSVSIGYSGGAILLCIGIAAATGQLLMTEGYRHVTVVAGSLLGMLVPILNLLVGTLLFHESLSRRGLLGAVVVILSCSLVIIIDRRRRGHSEQPLPSDGLKPAPEASVRTGENMNRRTLPLALVATILLLNGCGTHYGSYSFQMKSESSARNSVSGKGVTH